MSPGGSVQDEFGNSDEVDLAMAGGVQDGANETAHSSYRMDWSVDLETCTASDPQLQMVIEGSSVHNGIADPNGSLSSVSDYDAQWSIP